jgi:hypothetical protein
MSKNRKGAGVVVLALALLFVLGFRVGHPQAGLTNALGSATSSLVVYQKADAYSAGQKVIAKSGDAARSPFLGQISGATGDRYDVANGQFTEQITASDISGKMVFVIPFLGVLLGWVGL